VKNIPERRRQTDGQTDEQTTYCGITALCVASGGKTTVLALTMIQMCITLSTLQFNSGTALDDDDDQTQRT